MIWKVPSRLSFRESTEVRLSISTSALSGSYPEDFHSLLPIWHNLYLVKNSRVRGTVLHVCRTSPNVAGIAEKRWD